MREFGRRVFFAVVWTTWDCRNQLVFKIKNPDFKQIVDMVKFKIAWWFSTMLGIQYSNTTEIWAIHRAVEICASNSKLIGMNIIIISNSNVVVSWVNDDGFGNLDHINWIYDIQSMLEIIGDTKVIFNPRSSNSYADMLTKRGSNMEGNVFEIGDL
ncbi:hypothetical protein Dsin_008649 [Dipteronia sinensis]|uniref:RNase H type-1 domain-containing protein n=1 Tax=Dipteronia sinensis TaxID=43782 RepID=A0AAE0AQ78_9ROSI|nr:hypothetical protein Dsin_008649 [Dipteronia sinensis]